MAKLRVVQGSKGLAMEELEISFQQSRLLDLFVLEGEELVVVLQTA